MPPNTPSDEAFTDAAATVTAYINDMKSGWDRARGERLRKLIGQWSFDLSDVQLTAAHDAEKC